MTALVDFAAERWYADKTREAVGVKTLDSLGPLEVVEVEFAEGEPALYTRVPDEPGWGELLADPSGGFAVDGEPPPPGAPERALGLDQSHSSWQVGEDLVKCYRRLLPGIHQEIELGRALTEAGFRDAPALRASLEWRPVGGPPVAIAVVHEFLPGAAYGWDWAAARALDGELGFAGEVGALVARLHEALRAAFPPRGGTAADGEARHAAAAAQLDRAVRLVGGLVAEHESRIRLELEPLAEPPQTLQRVHGDLHVGQLLCVEERVLVIDFEGEPGRSLAERRAPESPLRDLASLLRSLDHCGRYAVRELGGSEERVERWIAAARERAAAAYGPHDERELRALEWERAVYEFTYAAAYLPEWLYAPLGGLTALLRQP